MSDIGIIVDFSLFAVLLALHSSHKYDKIQLVILALLFSHVIMTTDMFTTLPNATFSDTNLEQPKYPPKTTLHQDTENYSSLNDSEGEISSFNEANKNFAQDNGDDTDDDTDSSAPDHSAINMSRQTNLGATNTTNTYNAGDGLQRRRETRPKNRKNIGDARTSFFDKLLNT